MVHVLKCMTLHAFVIMDRLEICLIWLPFAQGEGCLWVVISNSVSGIDKKISIKITMEIILFVYIVQSHHNTCLCSDCC